MGGWGAALKGAGALLTSNPAAIGTTLKYVGKTALYVPIGVYAGWKVFGKGEGLDEVAVGVALGEQAKENYKNGGAVDALKGKVAGQDAVDQSVAQVVVDGVAGQGVYQQGGQIVGNVVDGAGNVLTTAGQGLQSAYHGAGEIVSGFMNGQGVQQPYTDQQIYQAYQQQALQQQQPQGGGLMNMLNPFNAISNLLGGITSGGTGMSLAALIPAAFLMFGNFGWMGKIASLFLGSLAMKNMRQQQVMMPQQQAVIQQGYQPQVVLAPSQQEQYQQQLALAGRQDDDNNVVHRGRGV